MSSDLIPNFELPATNDKTNAQNKGKGGKNDKTPNQVWANIGLPMDKTDGTKGFVNLPYGVPCDGMKEALPKIPDRASVQNQDYYNLRVHQHQLFAFFESKMNSLKPGERVVLPLQVELYRVKEGEELADVNTEAKTAFAGLLKSLTQPANATQARVEQTETKIQ